MITANRHGEMPYNPEISEGIKNGIKRVYANRSLDEVLCFHLIIEETSLLLKVKAVKRKILFKILRPRLSTSSLPTIVIQKRQATSTPPAQREQIPASILHKDETYSLSKELLMGIDGKRGLDHLVSVETLNICIKKKHTYLSKQKQSEQSRFNFYFFDTQKKQVLNVIFIKRGTKDSYVILTAYYPNYSTLRHRFSCSAFVLNERLKNLPKV